MILSPHWCRRSRAWPRCESAFPRRWGANTACWPTTPGDPQDDGPARAWEPKRLRLRLFAAAGRIIRGSRRQRLRIAATWPWATRITAAITRLQALAPG